MRWCFDKKYKYPWQPVFCIRHRCGTKCDASRLPSCTHFEGIYSLPLHISQSSETAVSQYERILGGKQEGGLQMNTLMGLGTHFTPWHQLKFIAHTTKEKIHEHISIPHIAILKEVASFMFYSLCGVCRFLTEYISCCHNYGCAYW